jgi:dynein intermediate chain 2
VHAKEERDKVRGYCTGSHALRSLAFLTPLRSISWHPEGGKKVAIAYSILQFQQQPADMSLSSYVWDVSNPNYPDLELVPASGALPSASSFANLDPLKRGACAALVCLEYNIKDPHLILGGCYNGLLQCVEHH